MIGIDEALRFDSISIFSPVHFGLFKYLLCDGGARAAKRSEENETRCRKRIAGGTYANICIICILWPTRMDGWKHRKHNQTKGMRASVVSVPRLTRSMYVSPSTGPNFIFDNMISGEQKPFIFIIIMCYIFSKNYGIQLAEGPAVVSSITPRSVFMVYASQRNRRRSSHHHIMLDVPNKNLIRVG